MFLLKDKVLLQLQKKQLQKKHLPHQLKLALCIHLKLEMWWIVAVLVLLDKWDLHVQSQFSTYVENLQI